MTATITDFNQFTGLRAAADRNDPAALREVASQFEALFLQTMLKNMRAASLGDPIFGNSDQQEMYQGMLDQQFALEMASGRGVGLADMLVRQLGGDSTADSSWRPDRAFPISRPSRGGAVANAPQPAWSDPKAFARDIWPHAERAASRLNVAPEAIVAQAALETGWGAHVMPDRSGNSSLNLFGIKAGGGWRGEQVTRQTLEFENGIPRQEKAQFRAYPDVAAAFRDYTEFLTDNPRYSDVSGHGNDAKGFARALQSSGYATDPHYADKITAVMESPTMRSVMSELKNSAARPITGQLLAHAE
jgi:flagellar protein FlgJ